MHKPNRFIMLLLICVTGIFLYSGCAASSNSIRYNTNKEDQKENNQSVRFATKKETPPEVIQAQDLDTVDVDSDSADSDPDDIPAQTKKIDIAEVLKKYSTSTAGKNVNADVSDDREKILMEIIKYLNTPYKYGGNSKNGIDCSAFTQTVFNSALDISLERSASQQYHEGEEIHSKDDLEFGDLIFFNTRRRVKPGHVGIYIGDHLFAHASTKFGVIVSSLDDAYYSKRYMGGRRIKNLVGVEKISGNN